MRNISHKDGMLSIQEFGLYYAWCAQHGHALPTIDRTETGVECAGWFREEGGIFRSSWHWYDCGSVNTEIPDEDYDEIVRWGGDGYGSPVEIVFTEVTETYLKFVEGNAEWGWPTLYWG